MTPQIKSQTMITQMSLALCLGTFVSAYNSVCLTHLAHLLRAKNALSTPQLVFQLTMSTSAFNLGNIIGPLLYRRFFINFNHRFTLILVDFLSILCILAQVVSLEYQYLALGRLFLGLCVGISTCIVPIYLQSIAPIQISGKIGTFNQLMQTFGVLGACIAAFWIDDNRNDELYWRIFIGWQSFLLVFRIFSLTLIFPYDSTHRNHKMLKQFVKRIYSDEEQAYNWLIQQASAPKINKQQNKQHKRQFTIGIVLMVSNQLTAINAIIFYLKQLFVKIMGPSNQYSQYLMCVLAFVQILSTADAGRCIEKQGRKQMLLAGQFKIICILLAIFCTDLLRGPMNETLAIAIIVGLIFYHIWVHNRSLGPVCIIYCADILTDLSSMIICIKISSFTVAMTSEFMIEFLGFGSMFFIYAMLSIVAHLYLRRNLKETKGLSRQEINKIFQES